MAAPVIGKAGFGNVLALIQNLAAAWAVQTAQQGQKRGLATPGGAEDGVHLALLHLGVDAPQNTLFVFVGILQALYF